MGGMMFLGRSPAEVDAAPIVLPKQKTGVLAGVGAAEKVAAKANAAVKKPSPVAGTAKSAKAVATSARPKPAATPKPQPAAKPKPAPATAKTPSLIAANGLPTRSTGGKIDAMSRDEAAAGAASAGAGFVPLDLVKNSREAQALTLKLGIVLRSPGIIVFTRPKVVSLSLDGFRDRETVAQAAANALR